MTVALPPELVKLVKDQVKSGYYGNESEVVRDALRKTFLPAAPAHLEERLAAMASEPVVPLTRKDWDDGRKQLQKRIDARKKAK